MQLRKPKGDGCSASKDYRTTNLISHVGKARAKVTSLAALSEVAHNISPTQFGAMPGRGTRGAVAVAGEVSVLHQRAHRVKRRGSSSKPPPMLLAVLTYIEKAFDGVVRGNSWRSLEALEVRWDARANLEELHEGMCYLFRD
eukprot:8060603-Pyramimonas_sp.AAC.1